MKYVFTLLIVLCSCQESSKHNLHLLMREWQGKEIVFPSDLAFTVKGLDRVQFLHDSLDYKIVSYVDSMGCTSCKLRLLSWKKLINEVGSFAQEKVLFVFYFHPKKISELSMILERDDFTYPVCIDEENTFYKTNHLPVNESFHTFLLDKNNKVLAIGNPIHNPKVKELYLKIIRGEQIGQENASKQIITKVGIDRTSVSLGNFNWKEEQKATFTLKNTGDKLLVIQDIATSCGCTTVSYSKEPIQPGKETTLEVAYKADRPEHFAKTITVYCNAEHSPLTLKISGDAE